MLANVSLARVVLGYCCLVVAPVASLFGIVEAGNRLKAPVNIDGAWTLHAQSLPPGLRFSADPAPAMRVSQSGLFLTLAFNDAQHTQLLGEISGGQFSAGNPAFTIRADRFSGNLIEGALGCFACSPVPFRAERARP